MQTLAKSAMPDRGIAKINRLLRQSSKQRNRERNQVVTKDVLRQEVKQILEEFWHRPLAKKDFDYKPRPLSLRRIFTA